MTEIPDLHVCSEFFAASLVREPTEADCACDCSLHRRVWLLSIGLWRTACPGHKTYPRPRDVADGLSNTIIYGDRSQPSEVGECWNTWAISNAGSSGFWAVDRMYTGGDPVHNATYRSAMTSRAFSWHPAMCNFAFCDGSVRALSESIDRNLYQTLGGMNDGIVAAVP